MQKDELMTWAAEYGLIVIVIKDKRYDYYGIYLDITSGPLFVARGKEQAETYIRGWIARKEYTEER